MSGPRLPPCHLQITASAGNPEPNTLGFANHPTCCVCLQRGCPVSSRLPAQGDGGRGAAPRPRHRSPAAGAPPHRGARQRPRHSRRRQDGAVCRRRRRSGDAGDGQAWPEGARPARPLPRCGRLPHRRPQQGQTEQHEHNGECSGGLKHGLHLAGWAGAACCQICRCRRPGCCRLPVSQLASGSRLASTTPQPSSAPPRRL